MAGPQPAAGPSAQPPGPGAPAPPRPAPAAARWAESRQLSPSAARGGARCGAACGPVRTVPGPSLLPSARPGGLCRALRPRAAPGPCSAGHGRCRPHPEAASGRRQRRGEVQVRAGPGRAGRGGRARSLHSGLSYPSLSPQPPAEVHRRRV